jgi:hypothetical protein
VPDNQVMGKRDIDSESALSYAHFLSARILAATELPMTAIISLSL